MSDSGLILAFYRDHEAAQAAFTALRRAGFRRTASLHKQTDSVPLIKRSGLPAAAGALIGGVGGLLLSRFLPQTRIAQPLIAPALTLIGAGAGYASSHHLDGALPPALLKRHQGWLLNGETLLLAQGSASALTAMVEIIRATEKPALFVLRDTDIPAAPTGDTERTELHTAEQLREAARKLARRQSSASLPDGYLSRPTLLSHHRVMDRLKDNRRIIVGASSYLALAVRLGLPVSIAAEWLLDNGYIIEGQVNDAIKNLSRHFYADLPVLPPGEGEASDFIDLPAGRPRVYQVAVELVKRTDSRLDKFNITEWITAYQSETPLTMSELWALPLMLRVAIVENLRALSANVIQRQRDREAAALWANRLLNAAHHDPENLPRLFADAAQENPRPSSHFADRLVSNLYDEEAALSPARSWLESTLRTSMAELAQDDQRRQAIEQVSVANCVTSLRHLADMDWRIMFEALSGVESELRGDPSGVYAHMDFQTRDEYRHHIERLARGSKLPELEVTQRAIALSHQTDVDAPGIGLRRHIGYFLLDKGQQEFESQLAYRAPWRLQGYRFVRINATPLYFGSIALGTIGALTIASRVARFSGARLGWPVLLTGVLPASEVAIQCLNYLITRTVPSQPLSKMNYEDGIPDEARTIVVVPTLMLSEASIADDLQQLEIHYLANTDLNLRFALLGDYADAPSQHMPDDNNLLDRARAGIDELNARYRGQGGDKFFLFHRSRSWCDSEQRWMGRERKRGKLEELNIYLKGDSSGRPEESHPVAGDAAQLQGIKFVITLDADTQMPHDTARRLVETLAHPLNRPLISSRGEKDSKASPLVTRGYTIIQPHVSTTLPSATSTRFARWFSDNIGLDPYTHVISDVYQDLFNEGSYHGKGIYDLDAFYEVLGGRFPPSTLLSHDLIEGAHVRVGLASDIQLLDDFPSTYLAYAKRGHRWMRGDWQILDWIFNYVPGGPGHGASSHSTDFGARVRNPISLRNRWKVFDNLRRSLLPPVTVAFLVAGWLGTPGTAATVSLLVGVSFLWPFLSALITWATTDPTNPTKVARASEELRSLLPNLMRGLLSGALLPHQAAVSIDAIARVLYRRFVSHKLLLEWETARVAGQSAAQRERQFLTRLSGGGVVFSGSIAGVAWLANPNGFLCASPFLFAWSCLPLLVKWLHGKYLKAQREFLPDDINYLRQVARQTWRYFDDFVGPQTNWLAPDNYQERLRVEIAQRTSPTNIGMWLLAVNAAHDFGYITSDDAIGRLLPTMRTLEEIEKYRGHLLNWYEVQRREALHPRYVSTVDSGNLLGGLLTLLEGIEDLSSAPVLDKNALLGLADSVAVLRLSLGKDKIAAQLEGDLTALEALCATQTKTQSAPEIIQALRQTLPHVERLLRALSSARPLALTQRQAADLTIATSDPRFAIDTVAYWAAQIETQAQAWLHTASRYLQWQEKLALAPESWLWALGEDAATLRREALNAPSLRQLGSGTVQPLNELLERRNHTLGLSEEAARWLDEVQSEYERSRWLAGEMLADAAEVSNRAGKLADEMDFRFLYNEERKLFPIGYNVEEMRHDTSYYDLLASECRLASFIAVARDEVPVEHWLNLGRRYGKAPDGTPVLLSWTGTMFEYLMPLIFTPNYENSLLDWACKNAVKQQIAYGQARNVPWGISEAAFSAIDVGKTYQYKAFGVPVLGLKRGLEDELVVAPYASAMALMVAPHEALANLHRLETMGMRGDYGFYESIDFKHVELGEEAAAPGERNQNRRGIIVRTFMVHHQGMSLLALDNVLNNNVLQNRFSRQPVSKATMPLLYERIPIAPPLLDESVREAPPKPVGALATPSIHDRLSSPNTPCPRVNLLSNGNLSAMTTNAGGSYVRWRDFDITRWRADTTRDQWGSFLYIRDVDGGVSWSAAYQPMRRPARHAGVLFKPEKTEYYRRNNDIETRLHVCVSPEDDAEIRLLHLTNLSSAPRVLEVTSFMELSLAPHNGDRAHPAFAKLFVQTESVNGALLAWRRLRSPHDTPIWAGHVLSATSVSGPVTFETDRLNFLGRNRTSEDPVAMSGNLTNTAGAVLDPCFSLRQRIVLAPGQRVDMAFTTVAGPSREAVLQLTEKYAEPTAAQRALDLAWTHSQLEMHHSGLDSDAVHQFQQLASYMLYPFDALRAPARRLRANLRQQSGLWAHGISGDLPIMVLNVADERDLPVIREAMQAHAFWRSRGLKTDLVILNEQASGYNQELSDGLRKAAIAASPQIPHEKLFDQPGGVFLRANDQLTDEDLTLLLAVARVILVAARGPLSQQFSVTPALPVPPKSLQKRALPEQLSAPLPFLDLPYFNSLGGFTTDGKEYAIYLGPRTQTPLPWVNVIASPLFGTIISESGRGFTWYGNSQSNRLTPWSNDPVSEGATDAIYIRDEDTGTYWSPTPLPIREEDAYRARHGQGYTTFEHNSHAIEQELTIFVPVEGERGEQSPPVRLSRLKLKNASNRRRRLRVTHFADWVLGTTREEMQMHIVTQWDTAEKIMLARNHYRPDFSHRVAFASATPQPRSWSSDRAAFLGRNGSPQKPLAMDKEHLDERCGAGFDCCAAIQVLIDLEPGESTEVTFILGEANDVDEARYLVRRFREPDKVEAALQSTKAWWDDFLGALQVDVPDLSVNFLLNRWLPYQTLSCRIWGRSAWYQSGGAFGFRDQLQDVMAILHSKPELAREHILRAAAHQFEEGDVQHWWHPPSDAGVRTRFADDLLWLPYLTAHYVEVTGDSSILDEVVHFLRGEPLKEDEHEVYNQPQISPESASLFEHCRRAIDKGCTYGPHELPLMGTGDWNDGLNRVGVEGKGESVWMAWFLCDVLHHFAPLCEARGELALAADFRERAAHYTASTETHAWDGDWYVRAFFDDGSPMGAKGNLEAQIDSLPQSWAILTECGDPQRAEKALQAAYDHLVLPDKKMILLFTPAFDKTSQDPGYIKGYLPGVRENGGQYTHAATWLALAFAHKGDGDKAYELLRMLNPVEHALTPEAAQKYMVEPYVVVADVYNLKGHIGRGGWTWYTGSASWVYRVWIEAVLGFKLRGDKLEIKPCIPRGWPGFSMSYRYKSATYNIRVENPTGANGGVSRITMDDAILAENIIPLADDGQAHNVIVLIGEKISLNGKVVDALPVSLKS